MKSSKNMQKELKEIEYFKLFAQKRAFTLADCDFESRPPPEPDILYRGELETIAFELTNCLENEIQQDFAKLTKGTVPQKAVVWADLSHCESVLKSKLEKTNYQSAHPIELVVFYGQNGQNWAAADDVYAGKLCCFLKEWIASQEPIQFRRIWYLGEKDTYRLFSQTGEPCYEPGPNSGY